MRSILVISIVLTLLLIQPLYGGEELRFEKSQTLQSIKPRKPVRIKLKRDFQGRYSWEITGDSVDEIINADKRLKKLLNIETSQNK